MSSNFNRVKRDILRDMAEIEHHDSSSWADIMLRHTKYLETDEDQTSFWNFILNPQDDRSYIEPKFEIMPQNTGEIKIEPVVEVTISNNDDEKTQETFTLKQTVRQEGGTKFILVTPIECKS